MSGDIRQSPGLSASSPGRTTVDAGCDCSPWRSVEWGQDERRRSEDRIASDQCPQRRRYRRHRRRRARHVRRVEQPGHVDRLRTVRRADRRRQPDADDRGVPQHRAHPVRLAALPGLDQRNRPAIGRRTTRTVARLARSADRLLQSPRARRTRRRDGDQGVATQQIGRAADVRSRSFQERQRRPRPRRRRRLAEGRRDRDRRADATLGLAGAARRRRVRVPVRLRPGAPGRGRTRGAGNRQPGRAAVRPRRHHHPCLGLVRHFAIGGRLRRRRRAHASRRHRDVCRQASGPQPPLLVRRLDGARAAGAQRYRGRDARRHPARRIRAVLRTADRPDHRSPARLRDAGALGAPEQGADLARTVHPDLGRDRHDRRPVAVGHAPGLRRGQEPGIPASACRSTSRRCS